MMKKALKAVGSAWGQRVTILVLICVIMAATQPVFFRAANARSILLAIAVNGIIACGMLFTVLVGGLDLSVGSMAGFSACIAFSVADSFDFTDSSFILGCILALLLCFAAGYINGYFVTRIGVPAFVITMAMKYALYGAIFFITHGFYLYIPRRVTLISELGNESILGVPIPIVLFVLVVVICAFVLGKTPFGRKLYIIGGNKNVAVLSGINSNMNIRAAYIISSVLAGIGGILLASMNGQAGQLTALGYEGNVLMAMVVGGINLTGGEGGVPGAIFGALFVGIINNIMLLLSISSDYQTFIQGVIIVAAMTLNIYTRRGSAGEFKIIKTS